MSHIFNLKKDAIDHRDHVAMRTLIALPTSVTMLSNLGQVRNQGNAGSCTGQAGAGFGDWLFKTLADKSVFLSALFLYAEERIKNGDFPADDGSDSRTLMQVFQSIGICLDSDDPYADTKIGDSPTTVQLVQAGVYKIGAYHRVMFDAGLQTSRSVLASGYCHVIGIPVYQDIESDEVAQTGLLSIPSPTDTPIGGHEMLVYGYDDTKLVHLVRNSWGAEWGLDGNLEIPYGYYAAVGGDSACDAWVGHFGKPWV